MKASKNFATPQAGTHHLPSHMHHTTASTIGLDEPMTQNHIVYLQLEQVRTTNNYVLKVRMSAPEALALAEALINAANGYGSFDVYGRTDLREVGK
jgi:hypothetical protein